MKGTFRCVEDSTDMRSSSGVTLVALSRCLDKCTGVAPSRSAPESVQPGNELLKSRFNYFFSEIDDITF